MWPASFNICVLNSPDVIWDALVSQARKLEQGLSFGRAKRLIGNGLVMSEGESRRRQRRLMQPAFHRAQIARYMGTMQDVAVPRINRWPEGQDAGLGPRDAVDHAHRADRDASSSDISSKAIEEIERLLRVLLSELLARGITANVAGLGWVPTRSNPRPADGSVPC